MVNRLRQFGVAAAAGLALILWAGLASAAMPKNVILMISDGQGYNTVKATDYWTGSPAVYESFPVQYAMSTFSAGTPATPAWGYDPNQAWRDFSYVQQRYTDSAAAATAMATGVKIYDNVLNIDTSGNRLKTITECARNLDKASGVVTTVEISHATPAGMFAHNPSRNNYAAIANEMMSATSPLNVIMGAGNPNYNNNGEYQSTPLDAKYVGGPATWKALNAGGYHGYNLIQSKSAFEALAAATDPAAVPDKVVGIVEAYTTTQQARSRAAGKPTLANPSGVPFNSNVPSLATMTLGALNVLSKDPDGFFLMVEGGAVDWANHDNQLDRMIEEQMDFNAAVEAVKNWVEAHGGWGHTLLLVTADHECGLLWGAKGSFSPLQDLGTGTLPVADYNSKNHSNSLVPLYAIGAGADLLAGYADQLDPGLAIYGLANFAYVDNTELFRVMNGAAASLPGALRRPGSGLVDLGWLRRRSPGQPH